MRIRITALVFACSIPLAAASPPRPVVERVDNGHATMTLAVTSQSREATEVAMPIELPVGMTATGISIAHSGSEPVHGFAFSVRDGRGRYEAIVQQIKDPALLEYDAAGHATLRVFPIRRDEPATVVIELTATSLVRANDLVHADEHVSLLAAPSIRDPSQITRILYARAAIAPPEPTSEPGFGSRHRSIED